MASREVTSVKRPVDRGESDDSGSVTQMPLNLQGPDLPTMGHADNSNPAEMDPKRLLRSESAKIDDPGDTERKQPIELYHSDDSSHYELVRKQLVSGSRDPEGRQPIGRDLHSQLEYDEKLMKRIIEMLTNQLHEYEQEDYTDRSGLLQRREKMVASNERCFETVLGELHKMSQKNKRNLYAEIKKKDDVIKKTEEKLHEKEKKIRTELGLSPTASERDVKKKLNEIKNENKKLYQDVGKLEEEVSQLKVEIYDVRKEKKQLQDELNGIEEERRQRIHRQEETSRSTERPANTSCGYITCQHCLERNYLKHFN